MEKLNYTSEMTPEGLVIAFSGTVDHHSLRDVRDKIDSELYRSRTDTLILDLDGVEFMDSAGLGLIMGRYTKITDLGGKLILRGVGSDVMKIVRLAGLDRFIPIEKQEKNRKPLMKG